MGNNPEKLSRGGQLPGRFPWPSPIDAAIIAVSIAVVAILRELNAFEWFYAETRTYESLNLDDIANGFFIGFIALIVMLTMRQRRLRSEITKRTAAEAEAEMLARHDPLTGIANR